MAFVPIDSSEVEAGKANTTTLGDKIRTNLDDLNARIEDVEEGTNVVYPCIIFRVGGAYSIYGALDSIIKSTTNFNLEITGVRVIAETAGSSGTLEIEMEYQRGVGNPWVSVFTTKPSVTAASGSGAASSNAVLHSTNKNLQAGDLIRISTTSVQTNGIGFIVRVDYNRT